MKELLAVSRKPKDILYGNQNKVSKFGRHFLLIFLDSKVVLLGFSQLSNSLVLSTYYHYLYAKYRCLQPRWIIAAKREV